MEIKLKKIIIFVLNLIVLPLNIPYVFMFAMCEWLDEKDKNFIQAYQDAWDDWAISNFNFSEFKNKSTSKQ